MYIYSLCICGIRNMNQRTTIHVESADLSPFEALSLSLSLSLVCVSVCV